MWSGGGDGERRSGLTSLCSAVRFFALLFCSLQSRLERASLPLGEDREAGANPALPRNCKRGNCHRPLGEIPGRPRACPDGVSVLTREARRPARSVYFNLFRGQRRQVCAYSWLSFLVWFSPRLLRRPISK